MLKKNFYGVIRTLTYVRHAPELKKILIFLGLLDSCGHKFTGLSGTLKVSKGALVVMKEHKRGNFYKLVGRTQVNDIALVSEEESGSTQLWHQRLDHMSEKGLQVLMNCKLLPNLKTLNLMFCKHCIFGKQCRKKFKAGGHVSKGVIDYNHSNLWGLSLTIFYGGENYYVLSVDGFSRKCGNPIAYTKKIINGEKSS